MRIGGVDGEGFVYRRPVTDLATALSHARIVDLTQPLGPATVLWPGSQPFRADVEATHERDGGYWRHLSVPEHAGTHFDAPAHFVDGGIAVEAVPVDVLVRPVAVLDVRDVVGDDRGAGLWHAEGLVDLGLLPARGAWIVVAPLRLIDGSGSPARILAIVP